MRFVTESKRRKPFSLSKWCSSYYLVSRVERDNEELSILVLTCYGKLLLILIP